MVLQTKDAGKKPIELKVRVAKLKNALEWLKEHNDVYKRYCDISDENLSYYENNLVTTNDLNTVDQDWNPTPQETEIPVALRDDVFVEDYLDGQFPQPDSMVFQEPQSLTVAEMAKKVVSSAGKSTPLSTVLDDIAGIAEEEIGPTPTDAGDPTTTAPPPSAAAAPSSATADATPASASNDQQKTTLPFPAKASRPLSEFSDNFYTKCFPNLFPNGDGDFKMVCTSEIIIFSLQKGIYMCRFCTNYIYFLLISYSQNELVNSQRLPSG